MRLSGIHKRLQKHFKVAVILSSITLMLPGCSVVKHMIYKTTGDVMQNMAKDVTIPYTLSTSDLTVGCTMSEALSPLLLSFGRVTTAPDQIAVMMYVSEGTCEETRALEQELRYQRAIRHQLPDDAEDALISEKRHLSLAATRQYSAWKRLTEYYGEPGGKECPELDSDFDQFIYLIGLLSGIQALNNDIQAEGAVGVPQDIGSKVERGASCLDDNKWWGVPMAMKATIWAMLPGATPKGENPWQRLDASSAKGDKARVRLADVLHVIAAYTKGDMATVKRVIKKHVEEIKKHPSNPEYRLIDKMATYNLLVLSDKLWTEHTGHRTPFGGLGTFWDDKKAPATDVMNLDDL